MPLIVANNLYIIEDPYQQQAMHAAGTLSLGSGGSLDSSSMGAEATTAIVSDLQMRLVVADVLDEAFVAAVLDCALHLVDAAFVGTSEQSRFVHEAQAVAGGVFDAVSVDAAVPLLGENRQERTGCLIQGVYFLRQHEAFLIEVSRRYRE